MPKQSTFYFFTAVVALLLLTLVAFMGGLSLFRSSPAADTGGISAVAGGVSESLFRVLLGVIAVFLIVLFLALRKVLKRK